MKNTNSQQRCYTGEEDICICESNIPSSKATYIHAFIHPSISLLNTRKDNPKHVTFFLPSVYLLVWLGTIFWRNVCIFRVFSSESDGWSKLYMLMSDYQMQTIGVATGAGQTELLELYIGLLFNVNTRSDIIRQFAAIKYNYYFLQPPSPVDGGTTNIYLRLHKKYIDSIAKNSRLQTQQLQSQNVQTQQNYFLFF